VYRTVPPVLDRVSATLPLRLTRVVRREFAAGTRATDDPELYRYYADLTALHGVDHRQDVLASGTGNTFAALADGVLSGLVSPVRPVDLVVIAHALPDLDPRVSAGTRLTRTLPGSPLVFALSGPGASIGFTALRVAGDYTRRHSYQRVVVLVLDQTVLPYRTPAAPAVDAAVALLMEDAPGCAVTPGRIAGVAPRDVADTVAELASDARVIRTELSDRAPATGIWIGLALDTDSVLVDYDHARGELRYCAIRES
jgi:hypothetical protein